MYERTKPRFPFAPWNATPEQLIRTFVGRKLLLLDILNRIIYVGNGATPKHSLLVGQRGLGKTHLLCLIHHYVSGNLAHPEEIDCSFKDWISVLFVEEEYATSNTLANFLLYLCKKLKEINPEEELWQLPEDIIDQSDQIIFDCCFEGIREFSQKRQKKICILIDNLQKIFEDFTEEDQHSLRAFLTDQEAILLICSSQGIFKEVIDHSAPFYEYFEIDFIPELTEKEMLLMIKSRFAEDGLENEYKKRETRLSNIIPGIRKLTGGNPRLVLFLYDILLQSQTLFDIELSLKGTMDQLTDYFRGRLASIPPQSRKILDTISQMEGPSTPTEIARFSRLPVQTVNAQIKRLKQWGYIESSKREKKRTTRYDITDRLFRIWRQSATVAGKRRFKLLTEFLKILYTYKELEQRFFQYKEVLSGKEMFPPLKGRFREYIDELYYIQSAVEGKIRYDIFSTRIEAITNLKDYTWAEREIDYFRKESKRLGDITGVVAALKKQADIHILSEKYDDVENDIDELIKIERYQEALKTAETVLKKNPAKDTIWFMHGIASGIIADYEKTLVSSQKACELNPEETDYWQLQAIALRYLKRYKEALSCAEKAVSLQPENEFTWYGRGLAAGNLGDHEKALESFKKACELNTEEADYWRLQAVSLRYLKRYKEALSCDEKAVVLQPENDLAWQERGRTAGNLGDHEKALESFKKACELNTEEADYWRLQAVSLRYLKRYKEALSCAEKAVSLQPENDLALYEKGLSEWNLKNYKKASESFKKAAVLNPKEPYYWLLQSNALRNSKRYQEALSCSEKAVELQPENELAWYERGLAALHLDENEKALESFQKAAKLNPDDADYWRFQAEALKNLNRYQESLSCIDNAIEIDQQNGDYLIEKAWILDELDRIDEALLLLKEAGKHNTNKRDVFHAEGDILLTAGRYNEAKMALEKGLKIEPGDWDMLIDYEIARACLNEYGKDMEKLPDIILKIKFPAHALRFVFNFILEISLECFKRRDNKRGESLFIVGLSINSWQKEKWFGRELGLYLRNLIDTGTSVFHFAVDKVREKVYEKDVIDLLNPYMQASDFARTGDVSILERLFPEVLEIVLEIARKLNPHIGKI